MSKVAGEWTDARLDHLAAALDPMPAHLAALDASVEHLQELSAQLTPMPAQVAVLTATVDRLADENWALREQLAATERQLAQIAWGLVAALIGAAAALLAALT
jgi:outer membrane murein-binding lipoprotein Lpp